MPNTGDYIRKEREGVDLIIGMHKKAQERAPIGELVFFIVLPLAIAGAIWKQKEIKDFAQHSDQVSAVIKMVYPQWKTAAELAPPPLPMDQAGIPSDPGQPVSPDAQTIDGTTAPAGTPTETPGAPAPPAPDALPQVSPEYQGPAERGTLLH